MEKDNLSKLISNITFDDPTKPPILKYEVRINMEKRNLVMFYGEFGWAIGSMSGCGTAHCVSIKEVVLSKDEKLGEEK